MSLTKDSLDRIRATPDDQRVMILKRGGFGNVGRNVRQINDAIWNGKNGAVNLTEAGNYPYYADPEIDDWTTYPVKIGNPLKLILPGVEGEFDVLKHASKIRQLKMADISTQIGILSAVEALEGAGHWDNGKLVGIKPERVGVVMGTAAGGSIRLNSIARQFGVLEEANDETLARQLMYASEQALPGQTAALLGNYVNAQGPRLQISSECMTFLPVLQTGMDMLTVNRNKAVYSDPKAPRMTDADMVIVGAAEVAHHLITYRVFNILGALSTRNHDPERASRPWDHRADGLVFGDMSMVFALKTLDKVKRDTQQHLIEGEILGIGQKSDAKSNNPFIPDQEAQYQAMKLTLEKAGITVGEVDLMHGHATSTGNSEIAESHAWYRLAGSKADEIPVISTKSVTGHPLSAAVAVGVGVVIDANQRRLIPPNWNLTEKNPQVADIRLPRAHIVKDVEVGFVFGSGFGGLNGGAVVAGGYIQ